jgi:hypothetical protein
MTNLINEIKRCSVQIDSENGFAWALCDGNRNLFQVCLMQRKDRNGFKKAIDSSDCGHDDGICGDYNADFNSDLDYSLKEFLKLCRKSGVKVI